jgi:23S rRNA (cytidine2498-2'-O)-methyltransferase
MRLQKEKHMNSEWPPQFVFTVCQRGAEHALKQQVVDRLSNVRPAFSRPGFVTFKLDAPCQEPEHFQLSSPFARTFGFCLGKVSGEGIAQLATQAWTLPGVEQLLTTHPLDDLHVWQRDAAAPGEHSFEPGPTPLALEAESSLREFSPLEKLRVDARKLSGPSRRNRWVMDVVLVEPGEWWIGCHRTTRRCDCWPGGVPLLELPEYAVSRAYLKMLEALQWSALPMSRGDVCIELGCAPGGASQALLDSGLKVIGIDPAEVDPVVLERPNFTHVRRRCAEFPRKQLKGVGWLASDMSVTPTYTLDAVEAMVTHPDAAIRGMVLTLKLTDWKLVEGLSACLERIRSWGYRDIRIRQLAFNRQEICIVALRSRGQRRVMRRSRRRRSDKAHASKPAKPDPASNS